jgi:lactoylglutathione lyase
MITELFPILSTPDLPRALGFYQELLGATVGYEFPSPDGDPAYVGLDIGSSHLGIGLAPDAVESGGPRSMSLWLYADDCDATVERLRSAGVTITEEPTDQPWGERVARVLDPDGNEVIIGARVAGGG